MGLTAHKTSSIAILMASIFIISGFLMMSDESDAELGMYTGGSNSSSSSNAYSGVNCDANVVTPNMKIYVYVGSPVSIAYHEFYDILFHVSYVNTATLGYGLTVSNRNLTGVLTSAGTITAEIIMWEGRSETDYDTYDKFNITIVGVERSTPVTSISISGPSSGEVGDSITLTATASPSTANDRGVTFSITSGSSRATITSQSETSSGGRCTISLNSAGTITVTATASDGSGVTNTKTISITEPAPEYTYTLKYNANGGSGAPSSQTYTTTASSYTFTISSSEPSRSGYEFMGWSTSSAAVSASYQPGDTIRVTGTTTLYAVWQESVIEITSVQQDKTISTGTSFSYQVTTDVFGCTISVSGADWLSVSGNTVFGTPSQPGTFDITITASKSGYASDTQTFRITVVSSLEFTSAPTTGLIIVEV